MRSDYGPFLQLFKLSSGHCLFRQHLFSDYFAFAVWTPHRLLASSTSVFIQTSYILLCPSPAPHAAVHTHLFFGARRLRIAASITPVFSFSGTSCLSEYTCLSASCCRNGPLYAFFQTVSVIAFSFLQLRQQVYDHRTQELLLLFRTCMRMKCLPIAFQAGGMSFAFR